MNKAGRAADASRARRSAGRRQWDIVGSQGGVPVTRLRKTMLEELERRDFSQNTTRAYIRIVEDFARYFHRQPDQLGPERGNGPPVPRHWAFACHWKMATPWCWPTPSGSVPLMAAQNSTIFSDSRWPTSWATSCFDPQPTRFRASCKPDGLNEICTRMLAEVCVSILARLNPCAPKSGSGWVWNQHPSNVTTSPQRNETGKASDSC